ncbi:MAG: hypothetical protein K6F84_01595 [Lachnospiraceae bacterium]|nr:hypothetical protein [Lachnospiraceae bacterium]
MNIGRFLSGAYYKGEKNYLKNQLKYEVGKTAILFAISLALFAAGYLTTHTKKNLLTVVAVLGLLPACKSFVVTVMYVINKGCSEEIQKICEKFEDRVCILYDMIFTSSEKTYKSQVCAVGADTVCALCTDEKTDEKNFETHVTDRLKADGITNVKVKVFKDMDRFEKRLNELSQLERDTDKENRIADVLKAVCL